MKGSRIFAIKALLTRFFQQPTRIHAIIAELHEEETEKEYLRLSLCATATH